jgi:4-oxalocrotonate tautomerase
MPLIEVKLFDHRLDDGTRTRLIEKLTDAFCEATDERLRPDTWVILQGHPPENWGLGGRQGSASGAASDS